MASVVHHDTSGRHRAAPAAPIRVAVLDDHAAVRVGLEAIVGGAPDMVAVGSAADEAQLYWLLGRKAPSVVVLDVNHPGRDGLALSLRIRRRAGAPRIVLHPGRGGPLLTVAAVVAGVDAVVDKTASPRELLEGIRDAAQDRPVAVPPQATARAAARLDPSDHAILAMRLARVSWADVAATLSLPRSVVIERATVIVRRLVAPRPVVVV